MRLRLKLFTITLLAMLAFIGIGFAAWTFVSERALDDTPVSDKVAVAVELNDDFKLYNAANDSEITALYLICDAPTVATSDYLAGEGVYWSTSANGKDDLGNKLAVTNVYIKGSLNYNAEDGVWPISKVEVTFSADAFSVTSDYVNFGALTAPAVQQYNVTSADIQSANFALPSVSYKADALAINSVAGVTAMNTALGVSLTGKVISLSAQITDKIA